jgi:hypothetical protein
MRQSRASLRQVDFENPRGQGQCDGCGIVVGAQALRHQFVYAGQPRPSVVGSGAAALQNTQLFNGSGISPSGSGNLSDTGLLVCPNCYDPPHTHYRAKPLGPDPVPLKNPRPDQFRGP